MKEKLVQSPINWFGGKRLIASKIFEGIGEVSNYVEPFAGSCSILLNNPKPAKIETVNDINCLLINFWRAVSKNPEAVAKEASFPVSEIELHSRHIDLLKKDTIEFKSKMENDPEFFDIKMAADFVYGTSCSVGSNFLNTKGLKALPLLSSAGGGAFGLKSDIYDWFNKLQERTKRVRICCGGWKRVITPSVTYNNVGISNKDITGIALDAPYLLNKRSMVYKEDTDIYKEVCEWAVDNGDNPRLRLAVCGYKDDFIFPDTWQHFSWKSGGGLSGLGDNQGKINSKREMIYFSPNCLKVEE